MAMIGLELGFMRPERLWALWALPLLVLVYLVLVWRKRSRVRRQSSALSVLFPRRQAWKRHVAVLAAVASLASLILAWATPNGFVQVPRERATVFLVIDVSRSMAATDVQPNRMEAAQQAAKEFVGMLPAGFNVSLISFAASATLLVPPTTDRGAVTAVIDKLSLAPSTAIGEGVYTALDALALIPPDPDHPDAPPPAAIVLLSDGESNTGRKSAKAAEEAKAAEVPVFTIAYGTQEGTIVQDGQVSRVPVNKAELRNIANISGGKAYEAENLSQLREVYANISRSVGYEQVEDEITERFVGYAVVLGLIAALGAISLGARWP
ncbi:MAG: VWA domain-containing protein [Propionibacteriaceae bacterium]|nr:VWA domain-containing protein [Propionibacteriaceae bacterium]